MFCHSCGFQVPDNAAFCPKCGTRLMDPETVPAPVPPPISQPVEADPPAPEAPAPQPATPAPEAPVLEVPAPEVPAAETPAQEPVPAPPPPPAENPAPVQPAYVPPAQPAYAPTATAVQQPPAPAPKKKKKWPLLILLLVLIAVGAFVVLNWNGKIDYIGTVKAHQLFNQSQGIPLTCGEVMDSLLTSPAYAEREEEGVHYVDITGDTKGGSVNSMTITIRVAALEDGTAQITPESIVVGGTTVTDSNDVTKILLAMFAARQEGQENLFDVWIALGGNSSISYTEYVNEEAGISFSYPTFWTIEDPATLSDSERENSLEIFSHAVSYSADFSYYMQLLYFPNRPEAASTLYLPDDEYAANFSHTATVIETSVVEQGGVTMRKVFYSEPGEDADDFYWNSYLYAIGSDVYRVNFVRKGALTQSLDRIFDEVMDTFTVTIPEPAVEYPGQIVFDGVPTSLFLDEYVDTVIANWGTPLDYNYGGGYNYCVYDGIELAFDYEGLIYNAEMEAHYCTLDGESLAVTPDKLVQILGSPMEAGYTSTSRRGADGVYYDVDVYYMSFQLFSNGIGLRAEFDNDYTPASLIYLWPL